MDNPNNNIFAERIAELEGSGSIPDNGKPVIDNGTESVAGRTDPAIARSAGEAGSATGTTPAAAGIATEQTPEQPSVAVKRGRGRPPGPAKQREEGGEARNIRVTFVEKTLFAIHTGVATITKCPELLLEKEDAKLLGEAVAGVLAFHKIRMTPKQEAYGILMEAFAQVYPPMAVSLWFRKKMEAEERAKNSPPQPPKIVPFPTATMPEASLKPNGFDPTKIVIQ